MPRHRNLFQDVVAVIHRHILLREWVRRRDRGRRGTKKLEASGALPHAVVTSSTCDQAPSATLRLRLCPPFETHVASSEGHEPSPRRSAVDPFS